jgi:hypothetical protein
MLFQSTKFAIAASVLVCGGKLSPLVTNTIDIRESCDSTFVWAALRCKNPHISAHFVDISALKTFGYTILKCHTRQMLQSLSLNELIEIEVGCVVVSVHEVLSD